MEEIKQIDICIVGAGPGGAAAALVLAKSGIACHIFDKAIFPRDKICGDALSGKVSAVMRLIDLEMPKQFSVLPFQIPSYGIRFVAPNGKELNIPFSLKDPGQMEIPPGFIAKRIDFDNYLVEEIKKNELIHLHENTEIVEYVKNENGYLLSTKTGNQFQTKLLIVADGAHSKFARHHGGIEMDELHYSAGLRAYYKNVSGFSAQNFIELHFLKGVLPGYFWIFPLANGQANVGLGILSKTISQRKLNLKKIMQDIIDNHPSIAPRFKDAELVDGMKGYGLPLGSKKRVLSGNNYMLLGDAASLIDPFTGEGIGNAMLCGLAAARVAKIAIDKNDFSKNALQDYDNEVYRKLGPELNLSYKMQKLVKYPWLFNFIANKASKNKTLAETISCMFDDVDLRKKIKSPKFYFQLIFNT